MVKRLGIEQPERKNVTGTISMMNSHDEELSKNDQSVADSGLKTTPKGIILFPQPHDNPNDPLNWPIWKRDLCLLVVGFQTFLGGGQSPLLAAGMHDLAVEFDRPITTISYLVGGFMLALGSGSIFASPTAMLYGKRLVYLLGIFIFLMGSIWAGAAPDFGNLMGGRILTGFGASPTESLPSATIAEIYFAHERAYRVGIYTMLMLGGKNIVPLLSALVFQSLDRHWLFWILSMFLGMNLVLTYFFVPETFWDRSPIPNRRSLEETKAAQAASDYHPPNERPNAFAMRRQTTTDLITTTSLPSTVNASNINTPDVPIGIETNEIPSNIEANQEEPTSFKKKLALFSGRHTIDSWWMVALRPFFLYSYPSILFGSLIYSLAVVWLIVISETITGIFQSEGYEYNQQTIGLFYISPFIGGILGSLSAGLISDRLSRFLITRNDGVYEPEFRLFMLIPSTFFTALGLMGFGWSSYEKDVWAGPVILFGCLSFGSSMASTTAITFVVDSYKMFASEALVSLNFSKNLLGFIFSLFNNGFFDAKGGRTTFIVYGAVQIFVSLFGIPLYIYGKKIRSWTDEKEILKYLYHADNIPAGVNDHDSLHSDSTQDGHKDNESSPNTTN
ncbi:DEHA2B06644p [Debaryomyces hansenii CBS767]|uniref:DEHA2B06644p n=1 Tax=Debaryomyces hansenii (strain ATCC 36239 / CBS 767 / BCRC 21394 / JCM 1990 / NBRC 0083 / IGC 2968) TaxID=284592 RepID=Q6BX21_DEBHA|nr:DEHA2B06644p [Debaryomyces hansenii CBS767]CAG85246.2 DEHA2B06644p [Debaryomyces hansenii CBS767]|eukprot:XP_457248.2 DEHA2B06644p [Debaryomyces hansenii CBS767]